jgi:UDP-N-acetylglucosamine 4,6-dehydratase/5-epimerase
MNWHDSVVAITGGTGSFGRKFAEIMLREYHPRKLIIFSRDELKQHEMRQLYPEGDGTLLRFS